MLKKICKCGRQVLQNEICVCQKKRHKIYDKFCRGKATKKFYSSGRWKRTVMLVKVRANGLDEYQFSEGIVENGSVVHHIYTIDERPDLKFSLSNLIFVSTRTHSIIHSEYNKSEESKVAMQRKLWNIRNPAGAR